MKNKKGTQLLLGIDALGINIYSKDNKLNPQVRSEGIAHIYLLGGGVRGEQCLHLKSVCFLDSLDFKPSQRLGLWF